MATQPIGIPSQPTDPNVLKRPGTERPEDASRGQGVDKNSPGSGNDAGSLAGTSGEKLQISQEAQELLRMSELMSKAKDKLETTPDVRADRIREVKERLEAGVYDTKGIRDELAHRLSSVLSDLPLDPTDEA